ncbi:hypothetical protein V1511DRAFT_492120 [Dipodascopsis uninucleata]
MTTGSDPLTHGALLDLFTLDIEDCRTRYKSFVCQILQIKELSSTASGPKRYRFVVSDGENFVQSMLATQYNDLVTSQAVRKFSIIRVTDYSPGFVKDKSLLLLLKVEVLSEYSFDKIGSPEGIDGKVKPKDTSKVQPISANSNTGTTFYGTTGPSNPNYSTVTSNNSTSNAQSKMSSDIAVSKPPPNFHPNLYTIEGLSPYQNKWTIKARVTFKSEVKHYHNQRGEGKLFSVTFVDETGEIRATGFNDTVDRFYDVLREGEVYYISKCRVTIAKKQFSNVHNEYELMFERDTEIQHCTDIAATSTLPMLRFEFVDSLGKLNDVQKDAIIDVIGIIKEVRETQQITAKSSGRPYDKRDVVLVDQSNLQVVLSLWGKPAVEFSGQPQDVIAVKGAKVSEFNGKSLSTLMSSTVTLNPDINEAHKLQGWYESAGQYNSFSSMQALNGLGNATGRQDNLKTIKQVQDEQLGTSESNDYFSVKGTISHFRVENFAYPACPNEECNKKLIDDGGVWRCERCEKVFDQPNYRYVLTFVIIDHTGQLSISAFDDVGKILLGRPASEYIKMQDEDKDMLLDEFGKRQALTYIFRVRARRDTYQNQTRARFSAMSATPINYAQESTNLINMIKDYKI